MNTASTSALPVPDMERWNTDQVLAVYDLCQTISAALMAQHKDELLNKMMEIDERCHVDAHQKSNANGESLMLPFNERC